MAILKTWRETESMICQTALWCIIRNAGASPVGHFRASRETTGQNCIEFCNSIQHRPRLREKGSLSNNGLYGEAPPERGIFFRLQVYERVGISLVEVYKRVGKSVIWVREMSQRAEQMNFMAL